MSKDELMLLNGRAEDDKNVGKVTSKHDTVIYYMISSARLFCYVKRFAIDDFDSIFSNVHSILKVFE